jgi:hypothetical protein
MPENLSPTIALLEADVRHTVGSLHVRLVADVAARLAAGWPAPDTMRLVEQVQEELLETWVDTTWPACPRHGRHPLDFHADGWWWCYADGVAVCRLGALGTLRGGPASTGDPR